MPLELTDFDQAGLEVDALALIVAAAPPAVYADSDRGGTQTPEGGDIGIGTGETRVSRIRIQNSGQNVTLNDNDNPEALTMSDHFGASGSASPWTLYIQTDDGVASSAQLGNVGGNYVNFQFGTEDAAILNAIAADDRFLIGFARRLLPVAAEFAGAAGSIDVAVTKQATPGQPVAAEFAGAAGSIDVAVTKSSPGTQPVAAEFAGAAGSIDVAVTKQATPGQPVAAEFAGAAGSIDVAVTKQAVRQPRASLVVSQSSVEAGRSVELRWVTSDAVRAEIDNGIGGVPLAGSLRVSPRVPTTYVLTVSGAPGSTPATASVTVTVLARAERSLLPPNATPLERAMEAAMRQPIDIPIRKLWSAADCPVELLPYLAWALGVEEWDSDWPDPVKRSAVADAFRIHREKGTLAGLKRVMMNAGAVYEYTERPAGVAMTARLSIFNSNAVYLPNIARAINRVKRASLDLELVVAAAAAGPLPIRGGLGAVTFVEISDWGPYA